MALSFIFNTLGIFIIGLINWVGPTKGGSVAVLIGLAASVVAGILFKRLEAGWPLQADATLQYAKANSKTSGSWWPRIVPADRFRSSAYNTYLHSGLPPTPISNPSVASILAALNPRKTSCLFYFHDSFGGFHCTDTYAQHVALLKKYYGQGK